MDRTDFAFVSVDTQATDFSVGEILNDWSQTLESLVGEWTAAEAWTLPNRLTGIWSDIASSSNSYIDQGGLIELNKLEEEDARRDDETERRSKHDLTGETLDLSHELLWLEFGNDELESKEDSDEEFDFGVIFDQVVDELVEKLAEELVAGQTSDDSDNSPGEGGMIVLSAPVADEVPTTTSAKDDLRAVDRLKIRIHPNVGLFRAVGVASGADGQSQSDATEEASVRAPNKSSQASNAKLADHRGEQAVE